MLRCVGARCSKIDASRLWELALARHSFAPFVDSHEKVQCVLSPLCIPIPIYFQTSIALQQNPFAPVRVKQLHACWTIPCDAARSSERGGTNSLSIVPCPFVSFPSSGACVENKRCKRVSLQEGLERPKDLLMFECP